jgi:hypothetical protein
MRHISMRLVLVIALATLLSFIVIPASRFLKTLFAWERLETATLTVLKSENLAFLVTDRIVTQIAVEITDNSPLLGKREGILISTVTLYYGVDLQALDKTCISRNGNTLVVTVPDPRELDFSVDPASIRYITKRSGLNVIVDTILNKDMEKELRVGLHDQALAFMADRNLIPTRAKIVSQLNELALPFSQMIGVTLTFK